MFLAERLDMTDTEVDFTTKNRYLLKQILQKKRERHECFAFFWR